MPANVHRESAKIYQFPVKFRRPGERFSARHPLDIDPDVCDAAFDSWYHEDAIREAEEKQKPQA
ncbi:DUF2735 domain-containing protein [Rhizobium sullae]|uniref:DUF2735 domain-containing protein n=1 Tax=Rhizobium sullae TaxID=50338 RepID=A0A2N0DE66_RHISU|nr:DUF2735 domain-containing protein [Rhizobium sullae]PKA44389.1 DUF2735 domain-containing protein [Rhizobium sullae]